MSRHDLLKKIATDEQLDRYDLNELKWRHRTATEVHFGVREGIDPKKVANAGWGVIFAHSADPAIPEAFREALVHRRKQAILKRVRYYQEYIGLKVYCLGSSK